MDKLNEIILAYEAWNRPWDFEESIAECEQLSPQELALFADIWGEATDGRHWKQPHLSDGCVAAENALRERFPALNREATARVVKAASYVWK